MLGFVLLFFEVFITVDITLHHRHFEEDMEVFSGEEFRDWIALGTAIDNAPEIVPCTNYPDAFHPPSTADLDPAATEVSKGDYQAAKKLCQDCPVRMECLAFALKHEVTGIWGGLGERERRDFRYAMNRKNAA